MGAIPRVLYSKNSHSGDLSVDLTKAGTSIGVYNCTAETTLLIGVAPNLITIVIDGTLSDGFSDSFFDFTHFEIETAGTFDIVVRGLWK